MPIDLLPAPATVSLSRRAFVGGLTAFMTTLVGGAALALSRARRARHEPRRVTLARPAADGISFHGDVVLVRQGAKLTALSARCTHLGCRLSQVERGLIVCACHGSSFDDAGHRLRGPADRDLATLAIEELDEPGRIDVVLAD